MKRLLFILFATLSLLASDKFLVLCYHDVSSRPAGRDIMHTDIHTFIQHLNWLQANGYHPIGIDDILAAKNGQRPLPDKAVLLTFDDAYKSFYNEVYPILKAYKIPAVLAVVGSWIESKGEFLYGNKKEKRSMLMDWKELKAIAQDGLVEIASHSFDLHKGIIANPQGNLQPAAIYRKYDKKTQRYETDEEYRKRITHDLNQSIQILQKRIGITPRVLVWPYGAYNKETLAIAKKLGFVMTFTLDDGYGDVHEIERIKRVLVRDYPSFADFISDVKQYKENEIERVVHVDLDYIYDPDPVQQEKNLGILLDRIKDMHITTVYLQAFADPDGDGVAQELYFPNRHLPMRADLFDRVAWQLKTRCGVRVFAWMPVSAFDDPAFPAAWYVHTYDPTTKRTTIDKRAYKRLSIYNSDAKRVIFDIYEDLAKHCYFEGILFHDDAYLSDYEDCSASALEVYKEHGLPADIEALRSDPDTLHQWADFKTDTLIAFTKELAEHTERYRMPIELARNIYAKVIVEPASKNWFAQDFTKFLHSYDYVAIMAMPYMEKAKNPETWLYDLVKKVQRYPSGLQKSIFELQSVDWNKKEKIASESLAKQMRLLQENGARNYGYYPDDFLHDHPRFKVVYRSFSLQRFPFGR